MALGGTDLNLLVALEALLEEGSVTRAGRRLGMSQPAMSTALAKLRRRFDDELLVPVGRGYEPTPLARELLPDLRRTVALMHRALGVADEFDPADAERTFRVAMSDYAAAVILKPLLRLFDAESPRSHLALEPLDPELWRSRQTLTDLDVLLAPRDLVLPGEHRALWTDQMVLVGDRGNPRLAGGSVTLDDLRMLPQAAGTFGRGLAPPIVQQFHDRGLAPPITLQVTAYAALPHVVRGTDLVAVLPERLTRDYARHDPALVVLPLPGFEVTLTQAYWFSEHRLADPAQRWFHATLERAARELA